MATAPAPVTVPAEIEQAIPRPLISQQSAFQALIAEKGEPPAEATTDETTKVVEKKHTAEDADEATRLIAERLGFRKKKENANETSPEDKTKGKVKAAVTDTDAGKKVVVRKREPAADAEAVATVAANTAAKTVAQALEHLKPVRETKPDPDAEAEASLTEDEKEEYAVFKRMAEANPSQKELPGQYLSQIRKITEYQKRWEGENPGQQFDPNDEEHDQFYAGVTPKYNPKDFEQAKIDMAVDRRLAKDQARHEQERREDKAEVAVKDIEPIVAQSKGQALQTVLTAISPDLDKIVREKGWEAFVEADDTAANVLTIAANRLGPFIEAARQIDEPKSRIPINEKNPAHVEYVNYLLSQEDAVKNGPSRDRIRDGKKFATRHELAAMPRAQRADYWWLDDNELIARRVADEAELAKAAYEKEVERIDRLAEKRGYKRTGSPRTVREQPRQATTSTNNSNSETRSPESLGAAINGTSTSSDAAPTDKTWDLITKNLFGR